MTNEQFRQSEEQYEAMAIETIRLDAITNQVRAIRINIENRNMKAASPAVVRSMFSFRTTLRIAAAVTVLFGAAAVYKYASVNTQSLYNQQYSSYELTTVRGASAADAQAKAYRNKDWNNVVELDQEATYHSNKSLFLAAISQMELKQFSRARALFQTLFTSKSDQSFRDEAEYFSALACLADHQEQKGLEMIAQIQANPNHTYYPIVNQIPAIDLKIIELKKK